jgi:hypothetical protein
MPIMSSERTMSRDDVAQILWGELKDVAIALGTDDQSLLAHTTTFSREVL